MNDKKTRGYSSLPDNEFWTDLERQRDMETPDLHIRWSLGVTDEKGLDWGSIIGFMILAGLFALIVLLVFLSDH